MPATRKAIAGFLAAATVPQPEIDDVILAVGEACTNVLRHAFPDGHRGSYELRADLRPEELVIDVVDHGVGFDPMEQRSDGILGIAGRGLEIMRRVMSSVEVESPTAGGGTRLRLRKRLPVLAVNGVPDRR